MQSFAQIVCPTSRVVQVADGLEKHATNEDEYMINEKDCVTNRFISVPSDHGVCRRSPASSLPTVSLCPFQVR